MAGHLEVAGTATISGDPDYVVDLSPYLAAELDTHPNGVTTAQFCAGFAATPARLQRDLVVVRSWLGADPNSGERYLPDATRTTVLHGGHKAYQLQDVLHGADLFRRLRLRGQTRGPEGMADYLRALSLVTGPPYAELHDGGGIWLADDRDDQHLAVAIVDTATSPSPWPSKFPTSRWPGSPPTSRPPLPPTRRTRNSTWRQSPKPRRRHRPRRPRHR